MPRHDRPFTPSFALLRAAFESLEVSSTPSTLRQQRSELQGERQSAAEIRANFEEAVKAQVVACETRISRLTGQCEHLLAHLGHKPHRRAEFADTAESLLTCLVAELRNLAPRTDDDMPLP